MCAAGPLARPPGGLAAPPARFLWQRLTPGELGLELTTALAFAGVGLYVFVLYTVVISGGRETTPADASCSTWPTTCATDSGWTWPRS